MDARHAVTLWLVHRWIEERFSTDEEAVPAVLADGFMARLLDVAPQCASAGTHITHVPPDTAFFGCGAVWRIRR
ncbi:hypothetical protein [Streptomyces sp. NPDC002566]|uniref:hypothetical protein n=1 Tax=Streptomyces sp. NPDC002566 TaxID=3364650 RepID=UPI0036C6E97C